MRVNTGSLEPANAEIGRHRPVRGRDLDSASEAYGIAFALGFIALAFYLRHVTGMG
jgi:hypothetical protein